jgi:3'5'-cyclic nucleotide phosphodiesterase
MERGLVVSASACFKATSERPPFPSLVNIERRIYSIKWSKSLLQVMEPNVQLIRIFGQYANSVQILPEKEVNALLLCHDTDPFKLDDITLIYLAQHMLVSYGLVEKFHLDISKLMQFFIAVHDNYHKENSFHNFKHAWGTMHLTYQLLRNGADKHLTSIDILAVLIAAICHDLDHPGNNNAFEVATNSTLALTCTDGVVLERHHCSVALKILSRPGCDFTEILQVSDRNRLKQIIAASIMATDMSQHFKIVAQLISHSNKPIPFSKKNPDDRLLLAGFVLHSADVGAQTQARHLALQWTERCLDEFSAQGKKEEALGLPLTPYMQNLDDELTRHKIQAGFVGGIVIPLWSAIAQCFPGLQYATNQAISMKNYYNERAALISEQRDASAASSSQHA